MRHEGALLVISALLLAGCGLPPFNSKPVILRGAPPPAVVSKGSLPLCPQSQIWQAQALPRNMARLRLGITKLQAVMVLGDPAHAETFSLNNGAAVEVLFYHTPNTICRVAATSGELMPLVFQDDRLLGYGMNYYKEFLVPMIRQNVAPLAPNAPVSQGNSSWNGAGQGMPHPVVEMTPGPTLPSAPAWQGRRVQEDLPTPPSINRMAPPVANDGNGYSGYMQTSVPYISDAFRANAVGRGEPIR